MQQRSCGRRMPLARKVLSIVASVAVLGSALAGCAGSGGDAGTVTLRMALEASSSGTPPEQLLADKYTEEHPGVAFEIERYSDNYGQVLTTQLQAGNGPDIFYGTASYGSQHSLPALADAGFVLSLSGTPSADLLEQSGQTSLYEGSDGEVYGHPENYVPIGIVYNKTELDAAGLEYPTTFDELIEACGVARAAGKSFLSLASGDDMLQYVLALSTVYTEDPQWREQKDAGETSFADSEGWKESFDDFQTMYDNGCFQDGAEGGNNDASHADVANGRSLGEVKPIGVITALESMNPDAEFTIAPFPSHTKGTTMIFASSTDALGINADTSDEKKQAALDFLAWLSEPEQAEALGEATVSIPITAMSTGTFDPTGIDQRFSALFDILGDSSKVIPYEGVFAPNGEVAAEMANGQVGLMTGQTTIPKILKALDQAWEQ